MTDVNMDVDEHTLGRISASSSASEKLDITGLDQNLLNDKMKEHSQKEFWKARFERREEDLRLLALILVYVAIELQTTDMKSSFIAPPGLEASLQIIQGLDKENLKQWKARIRNGVERDDWVGLITHRTYNSYYPMVGLRFNSNHSNASKSRGAEFSHGCPDRIQCASFLYPTVILKSRLPSVPD